MLNEKSFLTSNKTPYPLLLIGTKQPTSGERFKQLHVEVNLEFSVFCCSYEIKLLETFYVLSV